MKQARESMPSQWVTVQLPIHNIVRFRKVLSGEDLSSPPLLPSYKLRKKQIFRW